MIKHSAVCSQSTAAVDCRVCDTAQGRGGPLPRHEPAGGQGPNVACQSSGAIDCAEKASRDYCRVTRKPGDGGLIRSSVALLIGKICFLIPRWAQMLTRGGVCPALTSVLENSFLVSLLLLLLLLLLALESWCGAMVNVAVDDPVDCLLYTSDAADE